MAASSVMIQLEKSPIDLQICRRKSAVGEFESLGVWTIERVWASESLNVWTIGSLNVRKSIQTSERESSGVWIFEPLNLWASESLNIWTSKHLNLWASGCLKASSEWAAWKGARGWKDEIKNEPMHRANCKIKLTFWIFNPKKWFTAQESLTCSKHARMHEAERICSKRKEEFRVNGRSSIWTSIGLELLSTSCKFQLMEVHSSLPY